jgi:hypothetical protein
VSVLAALLVVLVIGGLLWSQLHGLRSRRYARNPAEQPAQSLAEHGDGGESQ